MTSRLTHHMPRVRHQLGEQMKIGGRGYRVRGYLANRQATTLGHEPHLIRVLARAMTARAGPFVDVGVNVGQTLLKVLSIDPDRAYIGFEPQVGCCFCISQFLADNGLDHAEVLPFALSDREGLFQLFGQGGFDEMASATPRNGARARWVMGRVGDQVLEEIGVPAPGVVKIDVEGAELEVLTGLRRTLARAHPVVFFEVLPNFHGEDRMLVPASQAARNRARATQIHGLLSELGYRIQQIGTDGTCRTIERIELDDRENFIGRDYVAWPPFADDAGS